MSKVIVKIGNSQIEGKVINTEGPKNRDILDTAAAFPTKEEVVQIIEIAYTVWDAVKILYLSIKSFFF